MTKYGLLEMEIDCRLVATLAGLSFDEQRKLLKLLLKKQGKSCVYICIYMPPCSKNKPSLPFFFSRDSHALNKIVQIPPQIEATMHSRATQLPYECPHNTLRCRIGYVNSCLSLLLFDLETYYGGGCSGHDINFALYR